MSNHSKELINSIAVKLNEVFNKGYGKYEIYGEEIKQGLVEPCFFIKLLTSNVKHVLGKRYYEAHAFDVHYFPKSDLNSEEEMLDVADELYEALEYITFENGLVRGVSMNYEPIDNVLHFFVDYNFYVIREKERGESFVEFDYKQEVKSGEE